MLNGREGRALMTGQGEKRGDNFHLCILGCFMYLSQLEAEKAWVWSCDLASGSILRRSSIQPAAPALQAN